MPTLIAIWKAGAITAILWVTSYLTRGVLDEVKLHVASLGQGVARAVAVLSLMIVAAIAVFFIVAVLL